LVQLEQWRERFEALGVNVAGMTYDKREILLSFHQEQHLQYPLLHDEDAKHVNALGVRNEDYPEGNKNYGIPHPGILFIGVDGTIKGKYAVPGYRSRPGFDALLADIQTLVQ
jgi:peroxiredoxin